MNCFPNLSKKRKQKPIFIKFKSHATHKKPQTLLSLSTWGSASFQFVSYTLFKVM